MSAGPRMPWPWHAQQLRFLYGLAAAASVPVGQRCALLNVSAKPFKSQLKAVDGKSNTHRHADLLKLQLALAAV